MTRARLLAVALTLALVAAAPAPRPSRYTGKSSQRRLVGLTVSGDRRRLDSMRIYFSGSCDDGRVASTYTDIRGPAIANGAFSVHGAYTGAVDGSQNHFSVSGRVGAGSAHGKFSWTASLTNAGGGTVRCRTGSISWSAHSR